MLFISYFHKKSCDFHKKSYDFILFQVNKK